jgi:hypothetical protein
MEEIEAHNSYKMELKKTCRIIKLMIIQVNNLLLDLIEMEVNKNFSKIKRIQ